MQIFGSEILGRYAPPSQDIVAAGTLWRKTDVSQKLPRPERVALVGQLQQLAATRWPTGAPAIK